ncbi:MAG: TetR/AcrR family transcriptional regulator [Acidimicrobiia bacterium]
MAPTSPKQTPTRVRLTGQARRQRILDAARTVFMRNGFEGARTKQIADEGGMAEAMIYRHFDSKEELFAAAVVAPFEQVVEHALADAAAFPSISGHDRIEYSDRLHCEMHEAMRGLVPFLGPALFANPESGLKFYMERLLPLWTAYENAIVGFQKSHEHRDIDPVMLSRMMIGLHMGLAIDAFYRGDHYDPRALGREITDLVHRGLSGPPVRRAAEVSNEKAAPNQKAASNEKAASNGKAATIGKAVKKTPAKKLKTRAG